MDEGGTAGALSPYGSRSHEDAAGRPRVLCARMSSSPCKEVRLDTSSDWRWTLARVIGTQEIV
eukprot:10931883-Karenia_brevis.AAC.1